MIQPIQSKKILLALITSIALTSQTWSMQESAPKAEAKPENVNMAEKLKKEQWKAFEELGMSRTEQAAIIHIAPKARAIFGEPNEQPASRSTTYINRAHSPYPRNTEPATSCCSIS